jgi:hypothetical protein
MLATPAFAVELFRYTLASMTASLLGALRGEERLSTLREQVQDSKYLRKLASSLTSEDKPPAVSNRSVHRVSKTATSALLTTLEKSQPTGPASRPSSFLELVEDLTGNPTTSDAAAMGAYIEHHGIEPLRDNQLKYGFHGIGVLQALARTWMEESHAPKTRNYSGNLLGTAIVLHFTQYNQSKNFFLERRRIGVKKRNARTAINRVCN